MGIGRFVEVFRKRGPDTVVGLLLFAILTSLTYDLLVKPGLSAFGRITLDLVTLGSATIRDSAYASAAFDPRPVTPLLLTIPLVSLAVFPLAGVLSLYLRPRSSRWETEHDKLLEQLDAETDDARRSSIALELDRMHARQRRNLSIRTLLVAGPVAAVTLVGFSIHNQSILIWRTFHADLALLRPNIGEAKTIQLEASFAAMTSRADFQALSAELQALGTKHGKVLHPVETW